MKSVISWIGGKHFSARKLIPLFPEHHTYIEPFGGGAHVLSQKPLSPVEIYNDLNNELVSFLRILQKHPEKLIEELEKIPYSRVEFYGRKDQKPKCEFDRAVNFFYLNRSSFNGQMDNWSYSTISNRANRYHKSVEILKKFSFRMNSVQIENLDFKRIFEIYDHEGAFFYCDPPYKGKEHRYHVKFTEKDHEDLAYILKNIKGKAMVTYYPDPVIEEYYHGWERIELDSVLYSKKTKIGEEKGLVKELIYMSYRKDQMNLFAG